MKMHEKMEPFVPRAPKHHALFGDRYIKSHFFVDPKWTPSSRIAQYRCMVDLMEKSKTFNHAQGSGIRRKQNNTLRGLKQQCTDGRVKLKTALYGDLQRTRNLLHRHKDLTRLYQSMPMNMIADNINQRTFVKRKELDRLIYKKNEMSKKYETKLIELSRLQDRVKYQNEFILYEELAGQECRMNLKNSETRLRALKTITRAYNKIRQSLYQDAIYYGPVLNSLQDDINEQSYFIKQVIHLGRPALGNVSKLVSEYDIMEEQIRKCMQERLTGLISTRQKMAGNTTDLKKLVRKDSDFEVFPHRYDRETPSMTDLKNNLEDIEKVMKQVKQVTLCARAREVYPRMKKQIKDNIHLEKSMRDKQLEKTFLQEKDERAEVVIESLKYNVTDGSNARKDRIKELKEKILEEKKNQDDIVKHLKKRGEIVCYLRFSINQIVDVLRHVSEPIGITRRAYPNSDLKLPLLQFDAFAAKSFPPRSFEEDAGKILRGIKEKVRDLVNAYKEKKTDSELANAVGDYHRAYVHSLLIMETSSVKSVDAAPLFEEEEERGDPLVPTRKQIKTISEKIVEERSKEDD